MALITDLDDRSLVEHHHAGDEDAFRQIVERHGRSMYAHALRRLHDPTLAEDAVQEALLRAFRALPGFHGEYHLDAWLHRILTNVCHDIGRRQGRDTRLFDRVAGEHDVAAPPADDVMEAMPRQQLESALDSLPESYREVLLLRFADELSYADVALKAGITEDNARARVSRGRAMLRRLLEGASAAVFWLIPPLRRNQLTGAETDVAHEVAGQHLSAATNLASSAAPVVSHAAPAASQSTGVLSQAGTMVAQAVPSLVQAAPAVSNSAPAVGKAAVAVGLAASVAIPAGVAVEKHLDQPKPQPAVAAPAPDAAQTLDPEAPVEVEGSGDAATNTAAVASTTTTVVVGSDTVEALGETGGVIVGSSTTTAPTDGSTTTTAPSTTTTTAPTTTTTVPGGSAGGGETSAPPGDLSAAVTIDESGSGFVLDGPFSLDIDGQTVTGTISGKVDIAEADPKQPDAPREFWADRLVLQFADGTTAKLRFHGAATVTTKGKARIYDFTASFVLDNGAAYQLAGSGDLAGALQVSGDGSGKLALHLPGASSDA